MFDAVPFRSLKIPPQLACEFFAVFARAEYALKACSIVRSGTVTVEPAWRTFAERLDPDHPSLVSGSVRDAIAYLCEHPPRVQVAPTAWEDKALRGPSDLARALEASRRVRNNLFHGGKYGHIEKPERDSHLVKASLIFILACIEAHPEVQRAYHEHAL